MKNSIRNLVIVIGVIVVLVMNGLANALPFNGLTTGEISDQFEVYFVPAGYVFSIWGLIYLGLILFAIYYVLPRNSDNPRLKRIYAWFGLSCLANIVWLVLWHYEQFPLTLLAMVILLLSLIGIYLQLGIGKVKVSKGELWLVHVPFSIYLGWVSVATIANVTSLLDFLNWNGWGIQPQIWAVIMLIVGTVLAVLMAVTRKDVAYLLVFVWAFSGIAIKHSATPIVAVAAWVTAGVVFLLALGAVVSHFRRNNKH